MWGEISNNYKLVMRWLCWFLRKHDLVFCVFLDFVNMQLLWQQIYLIFSLYISNIILFTGFPSENPLYHPPPPTHQPTHSPFLVLAFPYTLREDLCSDFSWHPHVFKAKDASFLKGGKGSSSVKVSLWMKVRKRFIRGIKGDPGKVRMTRSTVSSNANDLIWQQVSAPLPHIG